MKTSFKWIGLRPRRFSPFRQELPITLNPGDTFKRVEFRFEVCGVVFNASGDVLMDNGNWMPTITLYTSKGILIGQRDMGTADNTEFETTWRGAYADRVREQLALS